MNTKQFEYVSTLAEKASFSRASEELNVSQPSLSQYIKRIEQELGVALFDRAGGDVILTDAGREFIDAGKKIIEIENQMRNRFTDLSEFKAGTLTIGVSPTRCRYLMPEIVKRFSKIYPGMHLVIEERFLDNLIDDAEHGVFDLCIATLPVDENVFDFDMMMEEEIVLAVPRAISLYAELHETQRICEDRAYPVIDITKINMANYVCLSDNQPTQKLMRLFCEEYGISVRCAVKCMSIETQFSMIKKGLGIGLIPSSLAKYSEECDVSFFSLEQKTPKRKMAVIYKKGKYMSEPIHALKEIMTSL